jgi:RNA polymerase sigma-70 factor (ECF subfamily)
MAQDCPEMADADVSVCLVRVRQGDETAIRALIQYMYPLVYKLVRANLPRPGEEEDLVQMVLVRVFKGLDQFSGQVPFKHWVSRVAVNTCLNVIRHAKRRPEIRMSDLSKEEERVVQALSVSGQDFDRELGLAARDLVQNLILGLKPKEQLLVRLVYLEGFSIKEASLSTGWSMGAITMRLSRAKSKMKRRYEVLSKQERG